MSENVRCCQKLSCGAPFLRIIRAGTDDSREHPAASRLKPGYAVAHYKLAWALKRAGRLDEALRHFREAAPLDPDLTFSMTGLTWILATHPNPGERDVRKAVELAQRALELLPRPDARSLDTLAAAYAAAGQYDRAVTVAHAATDLAARSDAAEPAGMTLRLALDERRQPYREAD